MSSKKTDSDFEAMGPVPSHQGEVQDVDLAHDAVFGDITEEGPNYRNVGWLASAALMMKTQIGLGVLSIPACLDTLGIVPGVIVLLTIGGITTWSDYMVGVFKVNHRDVYGIDDVGYKLFGPVGREVFAVAFCLFFICCGGSGMLSLSIGFNAVSEHGACTAVFVAVAAIIAFIFASIQTLSRISWLAWVGVGSIMTAILTVTIAVGVQDRPAAAPQTGPWKSDFKITNDPSFTDAISAVSSIIFAYCGTPGFFSIASEMRDPRLYSRSLFLCQGVITATYITIGCVVYVYCGSYVASPALGSAGATMKKVSYGLALPGLCVSTILLIHYPAKYLLVRILRGSKHLASNSVIHWATWLGCTLFSVVVAYVIASGIPVFGGLVSLVGALLGTLLSFQPMGCMWLYDNWSKGKEERSVRWTLMVIWSVFVIVSGTFLMIAGTYGSIVSIADSYREDGGTAAWTCADNSGST